MDLPSGCFHTNGRLSDYYARARHEVGIVLTALP